MTQQTNTQLQDKVDSFLQNHFMIDPKAKGDDIVKNVTVEKLRNLMRIYLRTYVALTHQLEQADLNAKRQHDKDRRHCNLY